MERVDSLSHVIFIQIKQHEGRCSNKYITIVQWHSVFDTETVRDRRNEVTDATGVAKRQVKRVHFNNAHAPQFKNAGAAVRPSATQPIEISSATIVFSIFYSTRNYVVAASCT